MADDIQIKRMQNAAIQYIEKGWQPTPLRGKAPYIDSWQKRIITKEEVPKIWNNGQNIGVLLGDPSGGLVDVDLDCEEAVMVAPMILDDMHMTRFGRDGAVTHNLGICPDAEPYKLTDPLRAAQQRELAKTDKVAAKKIKTTLVEIRTTGQQTMFPPSTHPESGSVLKFYDKFDPPEIERWKLLRARVDLIGAASLIGRYWPDAGVRRKTAMALAGILVRAEERHIAPLDADFFWAGLTEILKQIDEEWREREKLLERTRKREEADKVNTAKNWLLENEIFPKEVLKYVLGLFGIPTKGGGKLYADIRDDMNSRHAVVNYGGSMAVVTRQHDHQLQRDKFEVQPFRHFRERYENKTVGVYWKRDPIKAGIAFLEDPDRPQYEGLMLEPGKDVWMPGEHGEHGGNKFFNLWLGYTVDPVEGDWSLLKQHMIDNICQYNFDHFDYLLRWCAWVVQNPHKLPGVALAIRGLQGTGKGVFTGLLGQLFGGHYYETARGSDMTGDFNAHLQQCCLLLANEAYWAGSHKDLGALNALITDKLASYQPKFVNKVQGVNHCTVMITANADWFVPASFDARRFAVFEIGDDRRNDTDYFTAILKQMGKGGLAAMLHDLLALDLSEFNVRKIPMTQGLVQQKLQSLTTVEAWIVDSLNDGVIAGSSKLDQDKLARKWDGAGDCCHYTYRLHDSYCEWCRSNSRRDIVSSRQLSMELKRLFSEDGKAYASSSLIKKAPKKQDEDGLMKTRYRFPELELARKHISMRIGGDIDWE